MRKQLNKIRGLLLCGFCLCLCCVALPAYSLICGDANNNENSVDIQKYILG